MRGGVLETSTLSEVRLGLLEQPMRYVQNPKTAGRVLGGQAFVVTTHDQKMVTLNRTGTLVWELAERGCTVDEVVQAMVTKYGISVDDARKDAQTFLADLLQRGILVAT
jgi:hypothetical protein